ncbi:hypothetical protein BHE74_00027778 [Ensete ventricosum]|nr:hypothetical protein GW17_00034856 [Ensete ventricosum]RWW64944.1 hypothetical protein BHE74_00027778 [Ensete ventricosum]RZS17690.1 hypothetical protein BHM03_00049867 [Ensete ventricosum]
MATMDASTIIEGHGGQTTGRMGRRGRLVRARGVVGRSLDREYELVQEPKAKSSLHSTQTQGACCSSRGVAGRVGRKEGRDDASKAAGWKSADGGRRRLPGGVAQEGLMRRQEVVALGFDKRPPPSHGNQLLSIIVPLPDDLAQASERRRRESGRLASGTRSDPASGWHVQTASHTWARVGPRTGRTTFPSVSHSEVGAGVGRGPLPLDVAGGVGADAYVG